MLLRYPGGKTRAVKFLLPMLAADRNLLSPFFGGGPVECTFAEHHPELSVVGIERFEPIATFWQQALSNPDVVAFLASWCRPMTTTLYVMLQSQIREHLSGAHPIANPDYLAAITYAVNRTSFSGATLSAGRLGEAHITKRWDDNTNHLDRLRRFSMPNLEVHCDDGTQVLVELLESDEPDGWCIYADPPYKDASGLYGDRGSTHAFDHARLIAVLKALDTAGWWWVVSGDERMAEHYPGLQCRPSWTGSMARDKQRTATSEVVFRSAAAYEGAEFTVTREMVGLYDVAAPSCVIDGQEYEMAEDLSIAMCELSGPPVAYGDGMEHYWFRRDVERVMNEVGWPARRLTTG